MKPPKVIYVGAMDVPVKLTKNLGNPDLAGVFSEEHAEVRILPTLSKGMARDTLLHETLHAVVYLSGFRKAFGLNHEREETLVVQLTPWLLSLLRDNPKLVEFLMENREREY